MALPTLYEYYTHGGITAGLSAINSHFTLNNKNITLFSGATHYFRVPKEYWRDRLRKMRAAGLNTVETYVPWNLHEPEIGTFDFGDGGSDMSEFLDLGQFLKIAQEEDLFAIVRPGPYICSEWEFGGLPSWLLREKDIEVRTSDVKFMKHVERYFVKLLALLAVFQFTAGGPVIGFQVENEYGSTESKATTDKEYLRQLTDLMLKHGIRELLFTSDSPSQHGDAGTLPQLLQTANFLVNPRKEFDKLKELQKDKPSMAMEYWTGWFDHWGEKHYQGNITQYRQVLDDILTYPASVNLYMFHGGTNWGFLNGANVPHGTNSYQPDITSYDYDAPLTEAGDYTEKYTITMELIKKYNQVETKLPQLPPLIPRIAYPAIEIHEHLNYHDIVTQLQVIHSEVPIPMELLPINNNSGQSYGYIIYRTTITTPADSNLLIKGYIHDNVLILVNGDLITPPLLKPEDLDGIGYWRMKDQSVSLPELNNASLDIIVVNWGRNNFGTLEKFRQFKGLRGGVFLNGSELKKWRIMPLEFKKSWTSSLQGWSDYKKSHLSLYGADLNLEEVADSYIDMREWNTGVVIVNGFVLGRYMALGPQRALYLPAPLLKKGANRIVIFEHFRPATSVTFTKDPLFT